MDWRLFNTSEDPMNVLYLLEVPFLFPSFSKSGKSGDPFHLVGLVLGLGPVFVAVPRLRVQNEGYKGGEAIEENVSCASLSQSHRSWHTLPGSKLGPLGEWFGVTQKTEEGWTLLQLIVERASGVLEFSRSLRYKDLITAQWPPYLRHRTRAAVFAYTQRMKEGERCSLDYALRLPKGRPLTMDAARLLPWEELSSMGAARL